MVNPLRKEGAMEVIPTTGFPFIGEKTRVYNCSVSTGWLEGTRGTRGTRGKTGRREKEEGEKEEGGSREREEEAERESGRKGG
jgi:hypothetical protein